LQDVFEKEKHRERTDVVCQLQNTVCVASAFVLEPSAWVLEHPRSIVATACVTIWLFNIAMENHHF
jgi:hypothetical protein